PLPAASTTLVAAFADRQALAQAVRAVGASQLEPVAFDVHVVAGLAPSDVASGGSRTSPSYVASGLSRTSEVGPRYRLLIQFATTPAAIDAQIEETRRLLAASGVEILTGAGEADRWDAHARRLWDAPGLIVRA